MFNFVMLNSNKYKVYVSLLYTSKEYISYKVHVLFRKVFYLKHNYTCIVPCTEEAKLVAFSVYLSGFLPLLLATLPSPSFLQHPNSNPFPPFSLFLTSFQNLFAILYLSLYVRLQINLNIIRIMHVSIFALIFLIGS